MMTRPLFLGDAWQVPLGNLHIVSIDCKLECQYTLLDRPLWRGVCYGKAPAVGIHKQLGCPPDPVALTEVLTWAGQLCRMPLFL